MPHFLLIDSDGQEYKQWVSPSVSDTLEEVTQALYSIIGCTDIHKSNLPALSCQFSKDPLKVKYKLSEDNWDFIKKEYQTEVQKKRDDAKIDISLPPQFLDNLLASKKVQKAKNATVSTKHGKVMGSKNLYSANDEYIDEEDRLDMAAHYFPSYQMLEARVPKNEPNITTTIPPKSLAFELFHFDIGNPLERPAMTRKDRHQVTQGPANQQPAPTAPAINIVIPSGRKLKNLLQDDSLSPAASQGSKLKRVYRSPSPPEANHYGDVNQTLGAWLCSISNTPDARHIDLKDLHNRLAEHGFIDVPLRFLNGLPRGELKTTIGLNLVTYSFICMSLEQLFEKPLQGRDKREKFM
ncbi:hypothetical protein JB92DRAFT_2833629 [Gautieria morchelliformis]|nr:hypothetical protein JB92DRAFT_2833629 [Gautieria morchelliformis]